MVPLVQLCQLVNVFPVLLLKEVSEDEEYHQEQDNLDTECMTFDLAGLSSKIQEVHQISHQGIVLFRAQTAF